MYQAASEVMRLTVATTIQELDGVLKDLPHGVRFGIARDLDENGEAHRFEPLRNCAYYLTRHEKGIGVWRWNDVTCPAEAVRLRILIASLPGPLDERIAARIFEQATRRSVSDSRPTGIADFAVDPGGYPA